MIIIVSMFGQKLIHRGPPPPQKVNELIAATNLCTKTSDALYSTKLITPTYMDEQVTIQKAIHFHVTTITDC